VDLFVERLGVGIRRPTIFVQLLFEIQELCYNFPGRRIDAAPCAAAGQEKQGSWRRFSHNLRREFSAGEFFLFELFVSY
jgi:hypothetical protein